MMRASGDALPRCDERYARVTKGRIDARRALGVSERGRRERRVAVRSAMR